MWAAVVGLGLGTALADSPTGLALVRWVGAAALIGAGVWTLVRRPRPRAGPATSASGFARGLTACVANPRSPLTAISVLPQFALGGALVLPSTLALGLLWAATAAGWNLLGIWAVARGRLSGRRARWVELAGAWSLIGFGVAGLA